MSGHICRNRAEKLSALQYFLCNLNEGANPLYKGAQPFLNVKTFKGNTEVLYSIYCLYSGIFTIFDLNFPPFLQDFPFLRNHKAKKGVITMENNEMVAVCLDCYDSLRSQFSEAAKYGIPVDKRRYNWIPRLPPAPGSGVVPAPGVGAAPAEPAAAAKLSKVTLPPPSPPPAGHGQAGKEVGQPQPQPPPAHTGASSMAGLKAPPVTSSAAMPPPGPSSKS